MKGIHIAKEEKNLPLFTFVIICVEDLIETTKQLPRLASSQNVHRALNLLEREVLLEGQTQIKNSRPNSPPTRPHPHQHSLRELEGSFLVSEKQCK
jgi:hypothetical protein